jgi:fido (protein-threonine AMPylation protein)
MMPKPTDKIEDVVHHALAGKYAVDDDDLREKTIRLLLARLRPFPFDSLLDKGGDVRGVEDDAQNQIVTLLRLERDWVARPVADIDLETIHRALHGNGSLSAKFRTTEFVDDFEGEPPTKLADLQKRLHEINRSLCQIDALRLEPLERRAAYVAGLFSNIVGAHVFADGNGRVARIAAQYCLRRWDMDFVALPKVRNAPGWKRSLHTAITGDVTALASYFRRLIENETVESVERSLAESRMGESSDRR